MGLVQTKIETSVETSPQLIESLHMAREVALKTNVAEVLPAHLLLAMLEDDESSFLLEAYGIDFEKLRTQLGKLVKKQAQSKTSDRHAVFSSQIEKMMQHAREQAQKNALGEVDSNLILAVILSEKNSFLARLLQPYDLDTSGVLQYLELREGKTVTIDPLPQTKTPPPPPVKKSTPPVTKKQPASKPSAAPTHRPKPRIHKKPEQGPKSVSKSQETQSQPQPQVASPPEPPAVVAPLVAPRPAQPTKPATAPQAAKKIQLTPEAHRLEKTKTTKATAKPREPQTIAPHPRPANPAAEQDNKPGSKPATAKPTQKPLETKAGAGSSNPDTAVPPPAKPTAPASANAMSALPHAAPVSNPTPLASPAARPAPATTAQAQKAPISPPLKPQKKPTSPSRLRSVMGGIGGVMKNLVKEPSAQRNTTKPSPLPAKPEPIENTANPDIAPPEAPQTPNNSGTNGKNTPAKATPALPIRPSPKPNPQHPARTHGPASTDTPIKQSVVAANNNSAPADSRSDFPPEPTIPPAGSTPPQKRSSAPDLPQAVLPESAANRRAKRRRAVPASLGAHESLSATGSVLEKGRLVENVPRRMSINKPSKAEVRITRAQMDEINDEFEGLSSSHLHELAVTEAMTVQLRAPGSGFHIENLSPQTQWIDRNQRHINDADFGAWRWNVTPTKAGKARLQLVISARTVDDEGTIHIADIPDKIIELSVYRDHAQIAKRAATLLLVSLAGISLGRYGETAYQWLLTLATKLGQ